MITPPVGVYEAHNAALTLSFHLELAAAAAENMDVDRRPARPHVGDPPR